MNAILAILILGATFSVAVETKGGYVEKTFANSKEGGEAFWEFVEPVLKAEARKFKVCTVTLADDPGPIMQWLLEEDFHPALLSRLAYQAHLTESGSTAESPVTVANACLARMPFLRGPKK